MPNETADIQSDIIDHLKNGPATLDQLMNWLSWIGDPRWVMVALVHLKRDKKIRYPGCGDGHNHGPECTVEAVA